MSTETPNMERKENPIKISKIHFLVHPGFSSDYRTDDALSSAKDVPEENNKLLNRYIGQAENLKEKEDEIMVALTHASKSELKKDSKENFLYFKKLEEIRDILGRRLIVLSDNFDIFEGEETMLAVKKLAKARGYVFDENVLSEAYGEALGACVDEAAQNLNLTGNLKHKTKIRPELSDTNVSGGHIVPSKGFEIYKQQTLKANDRIEFDE